MYFYLGVNPFDGTATGDDIKILLLNQFNHFNTEVAAVTFLYTKKAMKAMAIIIVYFLLRPPHHLLKKSTILYKSEIGLCLLVTTTRCCFNTFD